MFLPYHQNQNFLFPRSLSDFIPADHEARIISDILGQMDLASFYGRYSGMGAPAYHPKRMLKVILYGFIQGISSSRKLARACEESLLFLYLSGMQMPVYRTFRGKRTWRAAGEEYSCGCPRELRVEETTWARFKLRQKQKEHEEVYRRRKTAVEPVFGPIKSGMGSSPFSAGGS